MYTFFASFFSMLCSFFEFFYYGYISTGMLDAPIKKRIQSSPEETYTLCRDHHPALDVFFFFMGKERGKNRCLPDEARLNPLPKKKALCRQTIKKLGSIEIKEKARG